MEKRKDKIVYYRKDPSGEYVYIGKYLKWQGSDSTYHKELRTWFIACGVILLFHVLLGFVAQTGMEGNPFMLMPYAANLLTTFLLTWKIFCLWKRKGVIKEYENDEIVKAIPWLTLFAFLFSLCEIGGLIQTVLTNGEYWHGVVSTLYPFMALCSASFSFFLFRRRMVWIFG